jgi:hypothetical protein
MSCYLVPPSAPSVDKTFSLAGSTTPVQITCPDGVGFDPSSQICFAANFVGNPIDEQGDWHFIAEFYDAQDELIADGNETFTASSFFILPESTVGVTALIASSLAALEGFLFLKSRAVGPNF